MFAFPFNVTHYNISLVLLQLSISRTLAASAVFKFFSFFICFNTSSSVIASTDCDIFFVFRTVYSFQVQDKTKTVFYLFHSQDRQLEKLFSKYSLVSNQQQSRETVVGTSASITISSVTTLNSTF